MISIYDIEKALYAIRNRTETLEVRGKANAESIMFIVSKCDETIEAIDESLKEINKKNTENEESKDDDKKDISS